MQQLAHFDSSRHCSISIPLRSPSLIVHAMSRAVSPLKSHSGAFRYPVPCGILSGEWKSSVSVMQYCVIYFLVHADSATISGFVLPDANDVAKPAFHLRMAYGCRLGCAAQVFGCFVEHSKLESSPFMAIAQQAMSAPVEAWPGEPLHVLACQMQQQAASVSWSALNCASSCVPPFSSRKSDLPR